MPPVRKPLSNESERVSETTPCPAKAASPCIKIGSTGYEVCASTLKSPASARNLSCLARVIPSNTGLTASKCDGLAAK